MEKEKEKAIELVKKFETAIVEEMIGCELYTAKECAKICVDEIVLLLNIYEFSSTYWQIVKQEIEKL